MDHFFDYFANHGLSFNFKKIYKELSICNLKKVFLCFHSAELAIIAIILAIISKNNIFWCAFLAGYLPHMVLDILFNPLKRYSYFFSYRMYHNFDKNLIFDRNKLDYFLRIYDNFINSPSLIKRLLAKFVYNFRD